VLNARTITLILTEPAQRSPVRLPIRIRSFAKERQHVCNKLVLLLDYRMTSRAKTNGSAGVLVHVGAGDIDFFNHGACVWRSNRRGRR